MALTDQLQRRQTEAQRLKVEHKRLSKEKLPVQETALIKQIEVPTRSWSGSPPCRIALITDCFGCQVYDRCITDLRSQLEHDGADPESSVAPSAAPLAVRPLIRQPRASIRTDPHIVSNHPAANPVLSISTPPIHITRQTRLD